MSPIQNQKGINTGFVWVVYLEAEEGHEEKAKRDVTKIAC